MNSHTNDIHHKMVARLNEVITPIEKNYKTLLQNINDAKFVLIGEATHGTREFYEMREEISKQLILEKGFNVIAIEGDWPSVYPIHRYINGTGNINDWPEALSQFDRFPKWMWRNKTIPPFIQWLRHHNDESNQKNKVRFYGLDLYSLYASIDIVIQYLSRVDRDAAVRCRERYSCFDLAKSEERYGYLVSEHFQEACIKEALEQLHEFEQKTEEYAKKMSANEREEYFYATQNSRLIKNAEKYYRSMFKGHHISWNIRDRHMAETIDELVKFLKNVKMPAKIIVWAHNSHLGDARATEMGLEGEINLGQLLREKYEKEVYSIGFSTFEGTVTAADVWGDPPQKKIVAPGFSESYEELFHELALPNFMLNLLIKNQKLEEYLSIPRLQRAIGVIYRPETERFSHYFFTRLNKQFNCIIHLDRTEAIEPLDD